MPKDSKIEWTDFTWNPVTGCTKLSEGCRNCYAERMARRLKAMRMPRYARGFEVTTHRDLVTLPRTLRNPRFIFVNSMSDLFHEGVSDDFIQDVFATMRDCPQHVFQVLTKRSQRLRSLSPHLPWPKNVWMGVTVENADSVHRILDLQCVPAHVRFLSLEPLLGPLDDLPLNGISWAIVGRVRARGKAYVERLGGIHSSSVPATSMSPSSSSNGAASRRTLPAGDLTAEFTMKCLHSTRLQT